MRFVATNLSGVYIVELDRIEDDRGFFARTFCAREFAANGFATTLAQCNTSWNVRKGTIRGLHFQLSPSCEAKLVRCTAGALWDVAVDLRPKSPTHLRHVAVELSAKNRRALYIPEMFAHGFQTLEDATELFYQMSEFYAPEHSTGIRFNDPKLGISWPLSVTAISEKDANWPLLD